MNTTPSQPTFTLRFEVNSATFIVQLLRTSCYIRTPYVCPRPRP